MKFYTISINGAAKSLDAALYKLTESTNKAEKPGVVNYITEANAVDGKPMEVEVVIKDIGTPVLQKKGDDSAILSSVYIVAEDTTSDDEVINSAVDAINIYYAGLAELIKAANTYTIDNAIVHIVGSDDKTATKKKDKK